MANWYCSERNTKFIWYVFSRDSDWKWVRESSCENFRRRGEHYFAVQLRNFIHVRYVIGRPSVCRLSVVCRLQSVTFVRPTQAIEIFGNVSTPFGTDIQVKSYGDRLRGNFPSGELNTRAVAEYSDFGPIERYISETVQGRS